MAWATPSSTSEGFSPRRIRTMPSTPSESCCSGRTGRSATRGRSSPFPTSRTKTGTPPEAEMTILNVLNGLEQTNTANHHGLLPGCPSARHRHFDCLPLLRPRTLSIVRLYFSSARDQSRSDIASLAAKWDNVCDTGHLEQTGRNHPILQFPKLDFICVRRRFNIVSVQLPDGVDSGPSEGEAPSGSSASRNLFEDYLPGKIIIGSVSESEFNDGQSEYGSRPTGDYLRNAVESSLKWHRYLLLHFLCGVARECGDDSYLGIGDVRIGFNL